MGQTLALAWKDVTLLTEGEADVEKKPRIKAMDRTAGYLSQDPRSPARPGTDVHRTPILCKQTDQNSADESGGDNNSTPVTAKGLPVTDPRSPGVDRSPIVVAAEDGTPVTATPVLKSKSLASKLSHNFRQKALHKVS
jgi:hypothetical protein